MEITGLSPYKGDTWRLELDGETSVYINAAMVEDYGLSEGRELDEDTLEEIRCADTLRKAKKRALYLLGTRQYCYNELYSKLRSSYTEEIAHAAASYMKESGYVNDEEYASKLAEHLIHTKHWGLRKARYEMLHRGLDENLVEDALAEYDEDDIDEEITELIERKYYAKIQDYDDRRRTVAALARRGYDYTAVKRCIETILEDQDEDESE